MIMKVTIPPYFMPVFAQAETHNAPPFFRGKMRDTTYILIKDDIVSHEKQYKTNFGRITRTK
ncbi:MAG: hypothetical protein C4550_04315 [Nitrospiraceae bacterium]|nr:MAG: hypothetical protein C4550_04315 [Nitrospiraceae bacterium]